MFMKSLRALALAGLVFGTIAAVPASSASASASPPPVESDNMGAVLKGAKRYIVRFSDSMRATDIDSLVKNTEKGGRAKERLELDQIFKGSVIDMKPEALQALMKSGKVVWAEPDTQVKAVATQDASQVWGLDRIDQRNLPLNATYTYDSDGSGVTAYIVDTGILGTHTEFGSRVRAGYDALGGNTVDCNGHGTHVSGTVGGTTYGVAKNVNLVAVRVLDCAGSGSTSGVIAGIDWAVADHVSGPAVLNMSLGGGASASLNAAVDRAVADGISVVVAAGNSNADACTSSPASAASAITVGATASNDSRASYSNFGTCVDIFAPGSSIKSAYSTSVTATATLSGTSMASPHVAGAVARYLSSNPSATPAQATTAILAASTAGVVIGAGTGSPNKLLYSSTATPVTTTTIAPTTTVSPTTVAPTTVAPTTTGPTTTVSPTTVVSTTTTTVGPTTTTTAVSTTTTVSPTTTIVGTTTTTVVSTTTTVPRSTTTTVPRTTTTTVPRTRPGKPQNLVAQVIILRPGTSSERQDIQLNWTDDPATKSSVIGHRITVYSSNGLPFVISDPLPRESVLLIYNSRRPVTLSFTVSAVNRFGLVSDASSRSNSVSLWTGRATGAETDVASNMAVAN